MKITIPTTALLLTFSLVTSGMAQAAPDSPARAAPAATQAVAAPRWAARGTQSEEHRYAAREAASPEAKNYRGGDVVVISASAVAIVLAIVLIVVLI